MDTNEKELVLSASREDAIFLHDVTKNEVIDLLASAMFQEIVRSRYYFRTKKKKDSQEFILKCFQLLTQCWEENDQELFQLCNQQKR